MVNPAKYPQSHTKAGKMANFYTDSEFSTFSSLFPAGRLYPASRSVESPLTEQFRTRKVPDVYRPLSTSGQSSGNTEQQRTTDLDDEEMRAVHSNYTACIGDQDLPPSAREMYRLVANSAVDALSGSNEQPSVSIQKVDAVRCMDRFIRETTLDLNSARRDLSKRTDDNRLFRFHSQLGDYAGALCTALKEPDKSQTSSVLSQPWTMIVKAIDKYYQQLTAWVASGATGTVPYSVHLDAIKSRLTELVELGFADLDLDIALFAIRSYARRNFIAHGKSFDLYMGENYAGLAEYLDYIDKHLEDVLPDEEKAMAGKWRRLLTFYRHCHIRQGEGGNWVGQIPLKTRLGGLPLPSGRPWGTALRIGIEMGNFRPPGLDGPPPANVSWNRSSYRRLSEPELRGIKRPAMEQSSEVPRVKRARVANCLGSTLEAIPETTYSDTLGNQRLQLKLHDLYSALAQHSPSEASKQLKKHQAELEGELGKLRGVIKEKEAKLAKKSQPRPKE